MHYNPSSISIINYYGELRNREESGVYLASEPSALAIKKIIGNQKFEWLLQNLERQSVETRMLGKSKVTFMFTDIEELSWIDQFLLSCGPMKDTDCSKKNLPLVLNQIHTGSMKPDGSIPNIGDITPLG